MLIDSIKKSDSEFFDEGLNDVLQSCDMDVLLRYFDLGDFTVKIRYYDSLFFGDATHQKTIQCKTIQWWDEAVRCEKVIQISMDAPCMNRKFLEEVSQERKAGKQYQLIHFGGCGLHTIHGALKPMLEMPNGIILMQINMILNLRLEQKFIHSSFVAPGRYSF